MGLVQCYEEKDGKRLGFCEMCNRHSVLRKAVIDGHVMWICKFCLEAEIQVTPHLITQRTFSGKNSGCISRREVSKRRWAQILEKR